MAEITEIEVKLKDKEVFDKIKAELGPKIAQACVMVQDSAKQNCPVDTGRLQGSILYEVEGTEGIVGSNVEYAPFVEAGTSRMSGRHFLENAGNQNREKILNLFRGLI